LLSAVLHNLQWDSRGEIIWGTITQALLKTVNAKPEEDDGVITQYAFTKGAKVAVLFKEFSKTKVKVSLRSRGALDVGQFAKKMSVQGGGHPRAAGCTIKGEIEGVQKLIIQALQEALRDNF
jgi:phosphoesterase RecJ-like protein